MAGVAGVGSSGWGSWGWAENVVAVIIGLNVFDLVMTLLFLQTGHCTEANPLMAALYDCSPLLFAAVKLTLVPVGTGLLLQFREFRAARVGLYTGLLVYSALAAMHCSYLASALL